MKRPIFAVVVLAAIAASLMAVAVVQATSDLTFPVDIDIRPSTIPNDINLKSKGVIPVAILGNPDFDPTTVDLSTVTFGPNPSGVGAFPAHSGHFKDLNGDGIIDLLLHFKTQDTEIGALTTQACITGLTLDGIPIFGCDSVNIVGPILPNG